MEEEAQRLAQAMMPLLEASVPNGQPARKLHRDNDVVRNVSEETANLCNHTSSHSGCGGSSSGDSGAPSNAACDGGEDDKLD